MSFILILMLSAYGSDGGNALTTATFASKTACETAGQEAQGLGPINKRITYRCVPKV